MCIRDRYENDRSAIAAKTDQAKEKLAGGLLDLKESAVPRAPEPATNGEAAFAQFDHSFEEPSFEGLTPVAGNGTRDGLARTAQTFTEDSAVDELLSFDHAAAPEPALDMRLGDDDVILDDDGIPTWQEP